LRNFDRKMKECAVLHTRTEGAVHLITITRDEALEVRTGLSALRDALRGGSKVRVTPLAGSIKMNLEKLEQVRQSLSVLNVQRSETVREKAFLRIDV
jgi:hypothetical protein